MNNTKIGRSVLNAVNGCLPIKTKSTYKAFLSFDPTRENFTSRDENGLIEYGIDNDMIEYQIRAYKCRSESPE